MATEDKVRVLRIIEYVGTRSAVEATVTHSIQGTRVVSSQLTINAATIGAFPEILERAVAVPDDSADVSEDFPPDVFGIRQLDVADYFFGPTRDLEACLNFPGGEDEMICKLSDDGSPDKPLYSWSTDENEWAKIISPVPSIKPFAGLPSNDS